jgi:hypothetical protein
MTMGYVYEFGDREVEEMLEYDILVEKLSLKFNEESKEINAHVFTAGSLEDAFTSDLLSDIGLV